MQKLSAKTLERSFKTIKRAVSGGADCPDWIKDNFHIISERYKQAVSNKQTFKNPTLAAEVAKLVPSERMVEDLAAKLPETKQGETLAELRSCGDIASAAAIIKIAEEISSGGENIPDLVKTLISVGDEDITPLVEARWRAEPVLRSSEPGYDTFAKPTKDAYRTKLAEYAKKRGVTETAAAESLAEKRKKEGVPPGKTLFALRKTPAVLWAVFAFSVFLPLAFAAFCFCGAAAFLLFFPIGAASVYTADFISSLVTPAGEELKTELDAVPDSAKTLVAAAALLNGSDSDEKLFSSLSRFAFMNPDKNVYFCLLADLPDSAEQYRVSDAAAFEKARTAIDALNDKFDGRFCLFMREREFNRSEGSFGGLERKRGAVCALVEHIKTGKYSDCYYGGDFIRGVKYIVTLDSDTNISIDSVKDLISVALHPLNRPEYGENRVLSGYGVIQPAMRTELKSAYATGFSRLTSGDAGADRYASAYFKRSQDLFGSGSFCGKGLIDVEAFWRYVCGKLPDGLVLSHDVVEGGILRTLGVSDISFTDSTPKNTVSYYRRLHRWMRGDFQNLYFVFSKRRKLLPAIAKWRILLSVLRHAVPVFAVLGAILPGDVQTGGFVKFLLAYSYLFLPNLLYVLRYLLRGTPFAAFRYFSKTGSVAVQTATRTFYGISSSCRQAFLTAHAYILAAYRMAVRKKTLEWTTAAQTEQLAHGLGKYVLDGLFSFLSGLLIMIFAPIPFARFAGLLFFIYPLAAVVLSRPIGGGDEFSVPLSAKQKEILKAHAKDMWRFYSDSVTESTSFLPPDNIQLSPVANTAMRTSPTNIGFYLVSAMAACDFGFISEKELYSRLSDTLDSVLALEKYRGNLYNWYDLTNCEVIGERFVSAVDSGNFAVMLSALRRGLLSRERGEERSALIKKCDSLLCGTDLNAFYDKKRDLFFIGCRDGGDTEGIGHYDMLMSEMRMTSYYAVSKGAVGKKHWLRLGRTVTAKNGYIGMLSWSGTAFEYLMPQLFLPLYRDSFIYESIAFAVSMQKSAGRIWGVSESAYYAFNGDMHYQYKANGIQALALRRCGPDEKVVSPYSSYLALSICPSAALKNLDRFAKKGLYGKYGMYEALDLNSGDGMAVKCYMAHHVGMSIIACLNACFDGLFIKRFMGDGRTDAAYELLTESVPQAPGVFKGVGGVCSRRGEKRPAIPGVRAGEPNELSPSVAVLSKGDLTAVISDIGHIGLYRGEKLISHTEFFRQSPRFTPKVMFLRGGKVFDCTKISGSDMLRFGFERGKDHVCHIASGEGFSGRVKYSLSKSGDCFVIETRAESIKKYDVMLAFEPVMETRRDYLSHISFKRLFVESSFDASANVLYFHRRSGGDGKHIFTVAVAPRDKNAKIKFASDRSPFYASSDGGTETFASLGLMNVAASACVSPYCTMKICSCDGGHTAFLIACGETKEECRRSIRAARCDLRGAGSLADRTAESLAAAILYGGSIRPGDGSGAFGINDIWSLGISGDLPLITVQAKRPEFERALAVVRSFISLARSGVRCDLVFVADDGELYGRPAERSLREAVARGGGNGYLGYRGGIFIVRSGDLGEKKIAGLKAVSNAVYDLDSAASFPKPVLPSPESVISSSPENRFFRVPDGAIEAGNGYFLNGTYTVDKTKPLKNPYTFVLTGRRFSSVLTQSSLGVTFYANAHECRIGSFFGDSSTNDIGERLIIHSGGRRYDACACAYEVTFGNGRAVYKGIAGGVEYSVTAAVCEKYPLKLIKLESSGAVKAELELIPSMGSSVAPQDGIESSARSCMGNACVFVRSPLSSSFPDGRGFIGVCSGVSDSAACRVSAEGTVLKFFIGACSTLAGAYAVASKPGEAFFDSQLEKASRFAASLTPDIKISTGDPLRDEFINVFVPYQVAACRFFARGSFYQSGGAYGFRDQLQDGLSLVYTLPGSVRDHIIRCCAHQYESGDVMHWWHPKCAGSPERGVKTRCSDDLLWLPYAAADYVARTGDVGLLGEEIHYLSSPPLGEKESERYETAVISPEKESVYLHCVRAFRHAASKGAHGLVLMGSCDWNDAFSLVGEKGRGESVFSTLLYIVAAEKFIPLAERLSDRATADYLAARIKGYRDAIEKHAFSGDRFVRAFLDDGTVLGAAGCGECEIDIISQAWAEFAGAGKERVEKGLSAAYERLYDAKNGLFKLFDPPFARGNARVGYVRGYAAGLRENGGQYSHGTLWGALAMLKAVMTQRALELFACVEPFARIKGIEDYGLEPYAVAADIYGGQRAGRGGWNWYTGAAAWYYKVALEGFMGIELTEGGKKISVKAKTAYSASIGVPGGRLTVISAFGNGPARLDGAEVEFPLAVPEGEHLLEVPVEP